MRPAPRYSPIAPIALLEKLQAQGLLGDYLLILTPDVLASPRRYAKLIDRLHAQNNGPVTIILDNGVIEQGAPVRVEQLLEAAEIVQPTCVAAPDALRDFPATRALVEQQAFRILNAGYELMLIPQGHNLFEIYACIDWMEENYVAPEGIKTQWWGIPRWITNDFGSRVEVVEYVNKFCTNPIIHLLGMSQGTPDDLGCLRLPNVRGIDSANPLVLGCHGVVMSNVVPHMSRSNYWSSAVLTDLMAYNVKWTHYIVGGS